MVNPQNQIDLQEYQEYSISRALLSIARKDLALAFRQRAELAQPFVFFLMVVSLFPLAAGPNPNTLQQLSGAIIWVAAILSLLMSLERLFRDDFNDGTLEQNLLSPVPLYWVVLVKSLCHWFVNILPLLLLSPLLALFLNMTVKMYWVCVLTLIIGTPVISLIGGIGSALTLGLQRSGVLVALLLIPLFIPLLIFATSAIEFAGMQLSYTFQIGIMCSLLLFALAVSPAIIAYSIKVSLN